MDLLCEILCFKTWWIMKDYSQRKNMDYNRRFIYFVKSISYKEIFTLYFIQNWNIDHLDIGLPYFYMFVKEIFFVSQSSDYSKRFEQVFKLQQQLYCLK